MASVATRALLVALLAIAGARAGSPVTCPNPQLSCQNTTAVSNLCCFNAPGGQLVQTQFWDTSPSTGKALPICRFARSLPIINKS
jgi:ribonuclease T2